MSAYLEQLLCHNPTPAKLCLDCLRGEGDRGLVREQQVVPRRAVQLVVAGPAHQDVVPATAQAGRQLAPNPNLVGFLCSSSC